MKERKKFIGRCRLNDKEKKNESKNDRNEECKIE